MSDETKQVSVENAESKTDNDSAEAVNENPTTDSKAINESKIADSEKDSSKGIDGNNADYEKHITYDDNGTAIYTDPTSKYQYVFDNALNQWILKDQDAGGNNPYENEHYKWCHETNKWILKDGADQALENEHYRWNSEKNEWEPKNDDQRLSNSVYKDGQHQYTDADGAVFFFDEEKKAWFPKIDDDFMAIYQTNYGFIDNTSDSSTSQTQSNNQMKPIPTSNAADEMGEEQQKPSTGKRKANPAQWFEEAPDQSTKVYVSNLPDDITEDEFADVMSKCGMIFRDPKTKKLKIKLYAEASGQLKGDGLVHYIRVESVKLAIDMLDGYDVRGRKIKVQRAQFHMRGEYNPKLKPKKNKQDKEKLRKLQTKLLDWRPEKMRGERSKFERVVILKNLFAPETFEDKMDLILEYQNNVREECLKCGTVRKVVIYSSEPDGIAEVRMGDPEEADLVIQMMDRRLFGSRMITAETWDGKTKYKLSETEDENKDRLSKWDEFLESEDTNKPNADTPTPIDTTEEINTSTPDDNS